MIIKADFSRIRQTRWHQYATRFLFGGAVTVFAGLMGDKFGPAIGGLFLAFPAIFPASASLIERHQKEKKQRVGMDGTNRGRAAVAIDAAGTALGSIGLMFFALAAWKLLPRLPLWMTLAASTFAWATTATTLWMARKRS